MNFNNTLMPVAQQPLITMQQFQQNLLASQQTQGWPKTAGLHPLVTKSC